MIDLRARYEKCFGARRADPAYLRQLADDLGISLPAEFLSTTEFFDGSGFLAIPMFAIGRQSSPNVLQETKRIRHAISLPEFFLVLAEPPESLIVLDCQSGGVTWCSASDAPRLGRSPLLDKSDVWPSFSAFFAFLLDEEDQIDE